MNRETPRWPDPLDEAAYADLAGDSARLVAPHAEAGFVTWSWRKRAAPGAPDGPVRTESP